jgi:hypothetical protein
LRDDLLTIGLERFSDLTTYIKQESEEKLNPKEQRKKQKQNLRSDLNNSDSQYQKNNNKKPTKTQTKNKSQEQSKRIQQLVQEKKQLYRKPWTKFKPSPPKLEERKNPKNKRNKRKKMSTCLQKRNRYDVGTTKRKPKHRPPEKKILAKNEFLSVSVSLTQYSIADQKNCFF